MKKITATTLAATMTLSLGMAPAADAASNKISRSNYVTYCTLSLDGVGTQTVPQRQVKNDKEFQRLLTQENISALRTSSDLGEAFGSSDAETVANVNNVEALQACLAGKDYQSQPMTDTKKAGIIIGVVIAILSAVATAAAPFLQQFMP